MYQRNKLILSNGTCLVIEGELVVCYDPYQTQINLTRGQQMMLKKLAANVNCAVKMTDLYAAYTGEIAPIDARGIKENVAKMKGTLPGFVKEAIKSVRGYGYQLIATVDKNAFHNSGTFELGAKSDDCGSEMKKSKNAPGGFPGLLGDYYGFFLDPVGSGTVLGAYIHIENRGDTPDSELKVSAILGIRSDDDLRDADIGQIFSANGSSYYENFRTFISRYNENSKRCFWAEGKINAHGSVAVVSLTTPIDARWTILLELSGYLARKRNDEDYKYKGGVGLTVAVTPSYGTFCCKLGLVRKSYLKPSITLNNSEIKQMLKISEDSDWNPLLLDIRTDRYWYNWFMTE